jgi:lipopolysaccharide transport system ATP-binding protein
MSTPAIAVRGVSKRYRVGMHVAGYSTLRERFTVSWLRENARRKREHRALAGDGTFWALQDVSFEVQPGEVVGVIGRNGAGKSTLLKILSRITEPTAGTIEYRGRLGSLLEVGTGFHPELSGRENIYLNGAILGMTRSHIDRNLDAIVSFAEVERFLDTPVKRYSSGMHLRLAFSVAAHLEPDVLIVDEVLAVGDLAFQRKCMAKMEDVAGEGRTVLFVSHNLGAVKTLCQTGVLLHHGQLVYRGTIDETIAEYGASLSEPVETSVGRSGWRQLHVNGELPDLNEAVPGGQPMELSADLDVADDIRSGTVWCIIDDATGTQILHESIKLGELLDGTLPSGRHTFSIELPALWLAPGVYTVHFKLVADDVDGRSIRQTSERLPLNLGGNSTGGRSPLLAPDRRWTHEVMEPAHSPSGHVGA